MIKFMPSFFSKIMTNTKSNNQFSHLVTLETYARRKRKSLKTIYNWIKIGRIEPVYIDGKRFVNLNR
jgi:hypothetical protein